MEIDEQANGTQVRLTTGDSLALRLEEKPVSGFRWALVHDGSPALELVGEETVPASGPPGSSGYRRWLFQVRAPGDVAVELVYCRSWETSVAPAQVVHVEVSIA